MMVTAVAAMKAKVERSFILELGCVDCLMRVLTLEANPDGENLRENQ